MATAMEARAPLTLVLNESLTNMPEELLREVERAHMMLEDDKALQDLDRLVKSLSFGMGQANIRASALQVQVADQQTEIDQLRGVVRRLERRVFKLDDDVWLRDECLIESGNMITELQGRVDQQQATIQALNATVETMGVGRDALEGTIAALESRIRLRDHTIAESAAHFMRLLNTVRDKDDLINQGFQELKAMSQENHLLKGEVEQRDGYITDCLNLLAEKRRAIRRLTKDSRAAARMNRRIMQARFHKYEAMKVRKGRAVLIKFNMKRMGLA